MNTNQMTVSQKIELAKKYGYTSQEINNYLATKPNPSKPGFLSNLVSSVTEPFTGTARNIVGAGIQTPLMLNQANANIAASKNIPILSDLGRVQSDIYGGINKAIEPIGLKSQDFENISNNPKKEMVKQIGRSAQVASYAVPFGKGANFLTKATLPGAGAAFTNSIGSQLEKNQKINPAQTAIDTGLGAGMSTALYGGGQLIKKLSKKIPEATKNIGDRITQSQYNLPRSSAKNLKVRETIGKLSDYGITNINDVTDKAPLVTGDNGEITKIMNQSIAQAKPVDTSGISKIAKQAIVDQGGKLSGGDKNAVMEFMNSELTKLNGGTAGSLNPVSDPTLVFESIKRIEKVANSFGARKAVNQLTPQEEGFKAVYQNIANELKDRLFTQGGTDNLPILVTQENLQKLSQVSPKLADDVRKTIQGGNILNLRKLAEPWVKGSIAAQITETGRDLATQTMAGSARGVGKLFQNQSIIPWNLLAVPLGSDTVNAGAGGLLHNLGNLESKVTGSIPYDKIINTATNMGSRVPSVLNSGIGKVQAAESSTPQTGQVLGEQSQLSPGGQWKWDATANDWVPNTTTASTAKSSAQMQGVPSPEQFQKAILNDLQTGGKNVNELKSIYNLFYPQGANNSDIQKRISQLSSVNVNLQAIKTLMDTIHTGQARGLIMKGGMALHVNPVATQYEALRKSSIGPLARTISGETGQLTDKDIGRAEDLLPKLSDTEEEVALKIQQLEDLIKNQKAALAS